MNRRRIFLYTVILAEIAAIALLVRVSRQLAGYVKQFHRDAVEAMEETRPRA